MLLLTASGCWPGIDCSNSLADSHLQGVFQGQHRALGQPLSVPLLSKVIRNPRRTNSSKHLGMYCSSLTTAQVGVVIVDVVVVAEKAVVAL